MPDGLMNGGLARSPVSRRAPRPETVLAIASLCIAMAFIDATIVNIAFPSIERSFPADSAGDVSWVLNAYYIVFASFLVASGRLGDVFGRRRMLVWGLALFVIGSVLCASADSVTTLVVFRVVQALGGAMLVPCSLALVLDAFPAHRRAHAVAIFSAVSALAAGIGPSLGGLLVTLSSWRLVFLVNLPVGIAAIALVRAGMVESRAPGRRRLPDLLGAIAFAGATGALVLAIVQGPAWGWGSVRILGALACAVALALAFAWRSSQHPVPIVDLALIRVRAVGVANAITIVAAAGFFGYTLVNVLFLTSVWKDSVLDAGLAITPGPFVAIAVAAVVSPRVDRLGARRVLVIGGLLWAAGVLWFVQRTGSQPDYLGRFLPGMVLAGIGAGCFFPTSSSVAVASAPEHGFATATSLNSVARQVGAALGVAIVVAIIGTPAPSAAVAAFHHAWLFGAIALAFAALGAIAVGTVAPITESVRQSEPIRAPELVDLDHGRDSTARLPRAVDLADGSLTLGARAESTAEFLGGAAMFSGLDDAARESLAEAATAVHLEPGEWLFHEGDPGDVLYVVRAGRLEVVAGTGEGSVLRVVGRGGVVGEFALLTSEPRSASVRAARATDLIAIDREQFESLIQTHPDIAYTLARQFAAELRATRPATASRRPLPVTVAVVALDERVPLDELASGLERALSVHATVVTISGRDVAHLRDPGRALEIYGPMLDRAAAVNDLILVPVASAWKRDPWSVFCLQQADRILAVSSGLRSHDGSGHAVDDMRGCDLVGWDVLPGSGGLAHWGNLLQPRETHCWRAGATRDEDLARTARRLTGRSVGIVLGGGGARAFAAIGALEELATAGVEIDRVGGVSMGAFIGALYASGMSPDEIDAVCYEEWVRRRPLGDYTLPRHALLRGTRGEAMVRRAFGQLAIEELPLSYFCVAADLRTGERIIHRHGLLADTVATSISLPVLAPPRVYGQRLLVDGAIADNLPVRPMAEMGEGPIIAVDIKAGGSDRSNGSGSRSDLTVPPLGETLMRVMFFGAKRAAAEIGGEVTLMIRPRNDGIGFLEFHQIDRAREAGRTAVREALERLAEGAIA